MKKNDLNAFLQAVVSEIQQTKILTLEVDNSSKIGFIREKVPITYEFLGRFESEELQENLNDINSGINKDVNKEQRKQLIFNCFEFKKNEKRGVIAEESNIKDEEDIFNKRMENADVIIKQDNGDILGAIRSRDYKGYINKGVEKLGIKDNKITLPSDSEICSLKTLLSHSCDG